MDVVKKILFYTENRWAFGSIHYGLCKELYKNGIHADVLDWSKPYTWEEFNFLNKNYDIFITNPDAAPILEKCGISLDKIIAVGHGQWDILRAKNLFNLNFSKLRKYSVVSEILKKKSIEFGINEIPNIVKIGIHANVYKKNIPNELKKIGYAGSKNTLNFFRKNIKRGDLVEEAVRKAGNTELIFAKNLNNLCMPSYYDSVDCVIMSSCEEGAGLPMMEAAAAGRLTIGTPVGYYEEDAPKSGGIIVGIEEREFVEQAKNAILKYKSDPILYKKTCQQIQEYAIENFDWSKRIESWIKLIEE